ncbi:uncharacterized protein C16orf95 homolog isoform X3 [Mustela putorius furo]|uniref:Uncharacterized protein C16orf95 homolog isoform X3 n=1 Tax=Mustela putorius furo TaxID=9669 RepID=A0A8U0RWY2_MUSPF|nr:uncharacterized protein C16orf95 homolog isoform X3 [Mustela putorius furo]
MGGPRERACLRARAGSCVLVRARAPLAGRSWTREGRLDCGHPPHDGHRSRVHGGPARVAAGTSGSPRVSVGLSARTAPRSGRESRPQTFGTEASPAQPSMCPVPSTVPRQPTCCECQARFGGFLPVPRVQAALPYWVPLSLRPRKQVLKRPRSCKGIQVFVMCVVFTPASPCQGDVWETLRHACVCSSGVLGKVSEAAEACLGRMDVHGCVYEMWHLPWRARSPQGRREGAPDTLRRGEISCCRLRSRPPFPWPRS